MEKIKPSRKITSNIMWAVLIIFLFSFRMHPVSGSSMDPTFKDGQTIFSLNTIFPRYKISNNDIVVAKSPMGLKLVIKRVAGVPGDTLEFYKTGELYVNGEKYEYGHGNILNIGQPAGTEELEDRYSITLEKKEYYLIGDNFGHSADSRSCGVITRGAILEKVLFPKR